MKKAILMLCSLMMSFNALSAIKVEHELGTLELKQTPKRVVVLGVGGLDIMDYFGIEPVAVSKAYLPTYLKKYEGDKYAGVGNFFEPDFEAIFEAKPDLILIGPRSGKHYKELTDIAPTLLFSPAAEGNYWGSTQQQWKNFGTVFGIEDKVNAKINSIGKKIAELKKRNQDSGVNAMLLMKSGENVTIFGANSRLSALYDEFGFTPAVEDVKKAGHGQLIAYEYVSKVDPDSIFVLDTDTLKNREKAKDVQVDVKPIDNALIAKTKAYKANRIAYLDVDAWYLAMSGITATENMIRDIEQFK